MTKHTKPQNTQTTNTARDASLFRKKAPPYLGDYGLFRSQAPCDICGYSGSEAPGEGRMQPSEHTTVSAGIVIVSLTSSTSVN